MRSQRKERRSHLDKAKPTLPIEEAWSRAVSNCRPLPCEGSALPLSYATVSDVNIANNGLSVKKNVLFFAKNYLTIQFSCLTISTVTLIVA